MITVHTSSCVGKDGKPNTTGKVLLGRELTIPDYSIMPHRWAHRGDDSNVWKDKTTGSGWQETISAIEEGELSALERRWLAEFVQLERQATDKEKEEKRDREMKYCAGTKILLVPTRKDKKGYLTSKWEITETKRAGKEIELSNSQGEKFRISYRGDSWAQAKKASENIQHYDVQILPNVL